MKVYFDLDSVIVDFNRGVEELCGLPSINQEEATDTGLRRNRCER